MPAHCFSSPTPISHLTALLPSSSSPHLIRTPSHPHQLHFDRTPSGAILDAPHLISDPGPGTILNNARSLSVPSQRQRIYTMTQMRHGGNAFWPTRSFRNACSLTESSSRYFPSSVNNQSSAIEQRVCPRQLRSSCTQSHWIARSKFLVRRCGTIPPLRSNMLETRHLPSCLYTHVRS